MESWIADWLSPERFLAYQRRAGFNDARALALYEWNSQMNAALMHDLAHLEVGLRNLYSKGLTAVLLPGETHWLEPAPLLRLYPIHKNRRGIDANERSRNDVDSARKRLLRRSLNVPPGAITAELTFGFWAMMTAKRLQGTVWPYLQKVLSAGTDREKLHDTVEELNKLRNRAAHHEPVKTQEVNDGLRRMQRVAKYVSPELAVYMDQHTNIPSLLNQRP